MPNMLFWYHSLLVLFSFSACSQQQISLPIRIPPEITSDADRSTCVLQDSNALTARVEDTVRSYYRPCSCGGNGWTRVAYLNMSDLNQQCPSNWNVTTVPVRSCGRRSRDGNSCDSVIYSVNNLEYSSVCGKILAIQKGVSNAFLAAVFLQHNNVDYAYVAGISLTHGIVGARQHIYTFATANVQQSSNYSALSNCQCTNTEVTWPYQLPSIIGNDYFCDTGNPGPDNMDVDAFYTEDPLWDGAGCDTISSCCKFNTPPWFCKTLIEPTSDDLEIRLCNALDSDFGDKLITFMDIYVK